jgi:hypothetical protein
VRENFAVIEEAHWDWLTDLPGKGGLGRGYEVIGLALDLSREGYLLDTVPESQLPVPRHPLP